MPGPHLARRSLSPRSRTRFASILIVLLAIACPAGAATIWTDGDGDGLPDAGPLSADEGEIVSVDIWIDSEGFVWTNYLAYVEWGAECLDYSSGQYYVSGGTNFPIDTFSHPSGVGFGGFGYNNQGVERLARLSLSVTAPVTCCVTPIVETDNPYGVFSALGSAETYVLFAANPSGTCWAVLAEPRACCFPDGSCDDLVTPDCADAGGSPGPAGSSCATFECPAAAGACCYPNGACTSPLSRTTCESGGGIYQGDGTDCAIVSCPLPTGACCYAGGSCSDDLDQEACTAGGGDYQGDGSTCADSCAFSTGACCLPNGTCTAIYTRDQCLGFGGTFIGPNTSCDGVSCTVLIGACCYADGTCQNTVEDNCASSGGVFQGAGTTCINVVCPQPVVACCLATGGCSDLPIDECEAAGGAPQPFGTSCATVTCPATGACCISGDCFPGYTALGCSAAGGIYQGVGSDCSDPFQCAGCDQSMTEQPPRVERESAPGPMRRHAPTPCTLAGSTNGTAANYRWYNVCSGYIWIFDNWEAGESVGVLFGGPGNEAVNGSNDVKRAITYYRDICPNYNQTVDVFIDAANANGSLVGTLYSHLDLDPGLRWNCSEFDAPVTAVSYLVVRTQHDGGFSPDFATDGPFANACDPNPPQRSFYYGINGSVANPWPGLTDEADNFLYWLILDIGSGSNAVESTTWGRIKGLFR